MILTCHNKNCPEDRSFLDHGKCAKCGEPLTPVKIKRLGTMSEILADKIISELEKVGLTPDEMLDVIRLAKAKYKLMKQQLNKQ